MNDTPLITVIVPTYRRPDMLQELLPILAQQMGSFAGDVEAIVVDNCPEASARDYLTAQAAVYEGLHYLHQPVSGVVHARNKGVAVSRGRYILFLDDDEVPAPTWLAAFYKMAQSDITLGFGRIVPRYETTPEAGLAAMVAKLFSRDYAQAEGADITAHYAELGTGNAIFHRETCLPGDTPFDVRFNKSGGEDIWMIKSFAESDTALVWIPDGLVEELVPTDRMTASYLRARRYAQGQLRCQFYARRGKVSDWVAVCKWMAIGGAQILVYGAKFGIAKLTSNPSAPRSLAEIYGGLGKVLWWRGTNASFYANSDA